MSDPYTALKALRVAFFDHQCVGDALAVLDKHAHTTPTPTPFTPRTNAAWQELSGFVILADGRCAEAADIFLTAKNSYLAGYAMMLSGNLPQAQRHWADVIAQRENHWCQSLLGMVNGRLMTMPTLWQVRFHLEANVIDLAMSGQHQMLHNVLNHIDFLSQINQEAFKLAGRALLRAQLKGEWLTVVDMLLCKGQKLLPADGETYTHLAELYIAQGRKKEAQRMLKQNLLIIPGYKIAEHMLAKL